MKDRTDFPFSPLLDKRLLLFSPFVGDDRTLFLFFTVDVSPPFP